MDPLKEIEAAEKRMNAARLFLLDHIDLPIRSGETYKTYILANGPKTESILIRYGPFR